jgi:hypothetical protein
MLPRFAAGHLAFLAALLLLDAAGAQHHQGDGTPQSSRSSPFSTTCSATLQSDFDRAVALLHAFDHDAARAAFVAVAARDPTCGMAYWGVAMSCHRSLSNRPRPEDLTDGSEAAAKAAAIGAATERERGYIAAIGAFYRDAETLAHDARAQAYRREMGRLYTAFPEDDHAAIFYALSLFATAQPTDSEMAQRRQAAHILNARLPAVSHYPNIVHYMIHSLDEPTLAELALGAAREFAARAPASPHPLHMPSHIFTRLGLWQESIASNLASAAAADRALARGGPSGITVDALHALDYLEYAYLQTCRGTEAHRIVERVLAAETIDHPIYTAGYAVAAIPARHALERANWQDAADLPLSRAHLPWERYPYALAITYFSRALGASLVGDLERARAALAELEKIQIDLAQAPLAADPYDWAGLVEAMRLAAKGRLAQREGRSKEALGLLRAAAELEEATGKHPVTPGAVLPAREILADLLLEAGRPAEALVEYEAVLSSTPKRLRALAGAARSAVAANHHERGRQLASQILAQCDPAVDWPEVTVARGILAEESRGGSSR